MSRPRLTLIVNNDVPCGDDARGAGQKSWSNQFDPHALKVSAPDLWSSYFRARFHSPREVALSRPVWALPTTILPMTSRG